MEGTLAAEGLAVAVDDEHVEEEEEGEGDEGVEGSVQPWPHLIKEVHVGVMGQTPIVGARLKGEEEVSVLGQTEGADNGQGNGCIA